MSHLNFSVSTRQTTIRRRAYNPRGKVSLHATSKIWTAVSIAAVMAVVFLLVWLI